jgi:hypothetical protein
LCPELAGSATKNFPSLPSSGGDTFRTFDLEAKLPVPHFRTACLQAGLSTFPAFMACLETVMAWLPQTELNKKPSQRMAGL